MMGDRETLLKIQGHSHQFPLENGWERISWDKRPATRVISSLSNDPQFLSLVLLIPIVMIPEWPTQDICIYPCLSGHMGPFPCTKLSSSIIIGLCGGDGVHG